MKQIITFFAFIVACGFAHADQFRIYHKNDETKSIQRFVTYYVAPSYGIKEFRRFYLGCPMLDAKAFIKKENLVPEKAIVAAFYCDNATYVIANDYETAKGKD